MQKSIISNLLQELSLPQIKRVINETYLKLRVQWRSHHCNFWILHWYLKKNICKYIWNPGRESPWYKIWNKNKIPQIQSHEQRYIFNIDMGHERWFFFIIKGSKLQNWYTWVLQLQSASELETGFNIHHPSTHHHFQENKV